jgi:FKBP-type peptidyl-prolyl cis-trans isomerase SlyD
MIVDDNHVVNIHYTLKNTKGEVLDSSEGAAPLAYIQGIGNLIPGLEKQLHGKKAGDTLVAIVAPGDAYGEYDAAMLHVVPKSGFQSADGEEGPEIGLQVQLETEQGIVIATVTAVEGENVTLDLNHPLAGEELHFDVEIIDVRPATKTELDHGHVHGEGGHHH